MVGVVSFFQTHHFPCNFHFPPSGPHLTTLNGRSSCGNSDSSLSKIAQATETAITAAMKEGRIVPITTKLLPENPIAHCNAGFAAWPVTA